MLDSTHKKEGDRLAVCPDEGGQDRGCRSTCKLVQTGPRDVVFK